MKYLLVFLLIITGCGESPSASIHDENTDAPKTDQSVSPSGSEPTSDEESGPANTAIVDPLWQDLLKLSSEREQVGETLSQALQQINDSDQLEIYLSRHRAYASTHLWENEQLRSDYLASHLYEPLMDRPDNTAQVDEPIKPSPPLGEGSAIPTEVEGNSADLYLSRHQELISVDAVLQERIEIYRDPIIWIHGHCEHYFESNIVPYIERAHAEFE